MLLIRYRGALSRKVSVDLISLRYTSLWLSD